MDYSLELILKYPLIQINLTEESDIMSIEGKMFVNNKDFPIALKQLTLIDGKQRYELETLDNAGNILPKIKAILRNNQFQNIMEVLDKIHDLLLMESPDKNLENYCDIYRRVIHEYSEFTKFFLNLKTSRLKEDLTSISASVSDGKSREHHVEITVDYLGKSADIFRISEFDLPQRDEGPFKSNENLVALFDQFMSQIELLQPYFDLMEEIDRNASIMDPDEPKKRDCYRRIWLGDNISTIITVDPYNIFQRPAVKFLGPDRLTEPYNIRLNENLGEWVHQENIFQGILDLLGLAEFPRKKATSKQVDVLVEYGECSICFSLRLNDKLPEIICTNKCCEKFYHNECLYDWLVCLNAKRVFNNISGNCPNCEKTISCPVLD